MGIANTIPFVLERNDHLPHEFILFLEVLNMQQLPLLIVENELSDELDLQTCHGTGDTVWQFGGPTRYHTISGTKNKGRETITI